MEQPAAAPVLHRASAASLELLVLGPLEASLGGVPIDLGGPKQRAVLALLALRAPRGLSVDGVIDGLWGESAPEAASSSVYAYISNLRTILGGGVERERGTYVLTAPFRSDAASFEEAVGGARGQLPAKPDDAAETLRIALSRWRGLPYADLMDIPGLQEEARRLEELRLLAVEMRFEAGLTAGKGAELVPALQALVVEHPLREQFRAQLMLALYRSGRQAEALRVYAETRDLLSEELGVDPSPELQQMELRILQQDDTLIVGSGHVTTQRLAFLFTDIEGSTRLWNSHRALMADALARHDEILRDAVDESGGVVFKHTGDGALAVFPGAEPAATAAERAQRALTSTEWGPIGEVQVRMAIDAGDVDVRDGDYFGPPLNRCARILAVANGGQVLLSSTAFDELSSGDVAGMQIRQLGAHRLRGIGAPERIGQLVFVGLPAEFPELRFDASAPDLEGRLEIGGLPGFELRERLGVGAWGSVYRAYQPAVGREVAVRIISADLANRSTFVRRFEAHARAVAQLEHPHIVPLYDFWRGPDGAYLVMQLMRGGSLAAVRERPWTPVEVVGLLRQVGAALAHAHGEGVAHGDLRPANVLFDGRGNAYLSDFALAREFIDEPGVPSVVVGSSAYQSPEVRSGALPDERSDLFSLAVLTHVLLTGSAPPGSVPLLRARSRDGGSDAVDAVLVRGTAAEPGDRFADVEAFVTALEHALGVGDIPDRPPVKTRLRNPFKGLRPFSEGDAADFHGRSGLIQALVTAVSAHRFVAVVGPSGSGKSSVVQAGLIPRLRAGAVPGSDEWFFAAMTPGPRPIAALADALRLLATSPLGDVEGRLLMSGATIDDVACDLLPAESGELALVIDQFEELFTLTTDRAERERFVDLLVRAVEGECRVRIILTLRADHYARPLEHPTLAPLISAGLVTVVAPTQDELVEAIVRPASAAGFAFEPGLPTRIAGDVVGQPGGLPLLQYALTEMVERRTSDFLTGADYEAIGTVHGAIARRAESVFTGLDEGEQRAARTIFLRLVSVDHETGDARRRARLGELENLGHHPGAVRRVLDAFGSSRLLLFDRDPVTRAPTVEVAHESLLREWGRLRRWIDDERTGLVLARRFRVAMAEWLRSGRSNDYLLTGDRLSPYRAWAVSAPLARDEQDFFDRSFEADEAIRAARHRRRRLAFGVVSVAATVASILAGVAFVQGRRADDEANRAATLAEQEFEARRQAEAQASLAEQERRRALQQSRLAEDRAADARQAEALARARELAASAVGIGDEDPQLAMLLALEAIEVAPPSTELSPQLLSALRTAIHADRLVRTIDLGNQEPAFVRAAAGGSLLVVSSEIDRVLSTETWDEVPIPSLQEGVRVEAVSPDASTALVSRSIESDGVESTELHVVDIASGSVLHAFSVDCVAGPSDWSPDGDLVVLVVGCRESDPFSADLFETGTWARVGGFEMRFPVAARFATDPGVRRLLIADLEGRPATRVIDTTTNEVIATFDSGAGVLSPDGSMVVGYDMLEMRLFDVDTGQVLDRLTGFEPLLAPGSAVFSPDGTLVTLVTEGAFVPVWDVGSGDLIAEVPAGAHRSVAFGATEDTLVTAAFDGTVSVWDLSPAATGELGSADVGWVQSYGAQAGNGLGVVWTFDFDLAQPFGFTFDPGSGAIGERLPEATAFWPAVAEDVIVYKAAGDQPLGPVRGWNPVSGHITDLSGCWRESPAEPCPDGAVPADFSALWSSVDGSEAGLLRTDGSFETWGAGGEPTGRVTLALGEDGGFLMGFDEGWVLVRTADFGRYDVFDRDTGGLITSFELMGRPWVRFDREGRVGIAWGFDSTLSVLHPDEDWSFEVLTPDLGDGTPRGVALSPTGDRVAVGAQDGFLRIFDVETAELLDEIEIGEVAAAYWIDDTHVGVGTRHGLWTSLTLDPEELVALARATVQRTFTPNECALYRLESCAP